MRFSSTHQPTNGVAIPRKGLILYVPQRGFFGNDTFSYEMGDSWNNTGNALVFVTVVIKPPQIISTPGALEVCEGKFVPLNSGNQTFAIEYMSSSPAVIAQVYAKHGQVRIMANFHQLWQPLEVYTSLYALRYLEASSNSSKIYMIGSSTAINLALSALIYTG